MPSPVLILPGIGNSGPQHWQSLWEQANPNFERIKQNDWDHPDCDEWAAKLETAIQRTKSNDTVIVAHSLACLVVARWAATQHTPIKAALLVAIPDPSGPIFPEEASGFSLMTKQKFDFRSIVVVSTDDPYSTFEYTAGLAQAWGSDLINIGKRGHINASSDLGDWLEGYKLLSTLRE